MQMDEELDEAGQFVLAVEGRIDVVPVSDIQSSTDVSYQQSTMAAVSTESALKSTGEPRRQRSNDRIKTAPSSVTVKKSYSTPNNSNSKDLYSLPRKGAFSKEREETNKKAFDLWLNKKLEEDIRKRSSSQTSSTTESTEEKRKLNQKAFEAWLGKKKSQQTLNSTKIGSRSSAAGCISVKSSCGFEEWVRKKNEEKAKRLEYEALKKKELEESAAQVDPVLSKKAYSR